MREQSMARSDLRDFLKPFAGVVVGSDVTFWRVVSTYSMIQ